MRARCPCSCIEALEFCRALGPSKVSLPQDSSISGFVCVSQSFVKLPKRSRTIERLPATTYCRRVVERPRIQGISLWEVFALSRVAARLELINKRCLR